MYLRPRTIIVYRWNMNVHFRTVRVLHLKICRYTSYLNILFDMYPRTELMFSIIIFNKLFELLRDTVASFTVVQSICMASSQFFFLRKFCFPSSLNTVYILHSIYNQLLLRCPNINHVIKRYIQIIIQIRKQNKCLWKGKVRTCESSTTYIVQSNLYTTNSYIINKNLRKLL